MAYDATLAEGCGPAIADLSFDMYRKTRTVQVHGAVTEPIKPDRGILAGCGIAVHHLKASVNHRLDVPNLKDYVDDLTFHTIQDTIEQAVLFIDEWLAYMSEKVPQMGPNLSVGKGQIFFNKIAAKKLWMKIRPDYKGKVDSQAKQLGSTLRGPNKASLTKGPKVAEACKRAKRIGALPTGVVLKGNMLKMASLACCMHGTASDPLTQQQVKDLRTAFSRALWQNKFMASTVTAILIASEGALDPGIAMTKKIVVNWKRQLAGGNLQHHDIWSTPHSRAYQHLGPIQLYRKTMASLGWVAIDPWNVRVDEQGTVKNILDWDDFVPQVMENARQREWTKAAKTRKHYRGAEKASTKRPRKDG